MKTKTKKEFLKEKHNQGGNISMKKQQDFDRGMGK